MEVRFLPPELCAADGARSHRASRLLPESLVGRLASQGSVRSVEVVEVLPLLELVVEQLCVVHHDAIEHPVELLLIDPVRPFDLAVQPRGRRLDVDVADPAVKDVVVELRAELVGLDHLGLEGQLLEHVVEEADRALLVQPVVDP
jgi:hypothetical protein